MVYLFNLWVSSHFSKILIIIYPIFYRKKISKRNTYTKIILYARIVTNMGYIISQGEIVLANLIILANGMFTRDAIKCGPAIRAPLDMFDVWASVTVEYAFIALRIMIEPLEKLINPIPNIFRRKSVGKENRTLVSISHPNVTQYCEPN